MCVLRDLKRGSRTCISRHRRAFARTQLARHTRRMLYRRPLALALTLTALGSACGSPAARDNAGTSSSAGGESNTNGIQRGAALPVLTERQLAEDASAPGVIVDEHSAWVMIPSFHLAFEMPAHWYWMSVEELRAQTMRTTGRAISDSEWADVQRSFRATVHQWRMDDASHAGQLVPSVRLFLAEGGGTPPPDACSNFILQFMRSQYPDAQVISDAQHTLEGRPFVRCAYDHGAPTVMGVLPGRTEIAVVNGESHSILIVSLGPQTDEVAANLDAVIATVRTIQ